MENIIISILLSSLLAGAALYKKTLTVAGVILAWIFSIIITYGGGFVGFFILFTTYLFTMLVGKIKSNRREKLLKNIHQKTGKRDAIQILSNVGAGAIAIIIFYLTKNNIYLTVYACVMAASLADSLASDGGVLSNKQPVDICTLKKTSKGLSGGVTILGLLLSLVGGITIASVYSAFIGFDLMVFLIITASGFSGSLIDSVIGSILQVKYRCVKCNEITEKKEHCNNETQYIKGLKFIDNDRVNLLTNIIIFILSLLILI